MPRFVRFSIEDVEGIGVEGEGDVLRGVSVADPLYPGTVLDLLRRGGSALEDAAAALATAPVVARNGLRILPPIADPGKIICIGLNYVDHSVETGFEPPAYPTVFGRWPNSLVGAGAPLILPRVSEQFDYEGEIAAIIGKRCSRVKAADALAYVAGYSIFNDGSIRDYQFLSPQWTMGKSFDGTGGFGPAFVTSDLLPPGAKGLRLETKLNGMVVQSATTDDMIFDVATLIELLSEAITLDPGDVIVTGTPAGVGMARKPQLWMRDGDVCEIAVEGLGILSNPVTRAAP